MEEAIVLSHREFLKADRNYERAADVAHLLYVRDTIEAIGRLKKGKGFVYIFNQQPLKNEKHLKRIKSLVIPPAWINVWICPIENGHIQATGLDLRSRKQYRYHPSWNVLRSQTKFHHLYEFGKILPLLRAQLEKDLAVKTLTREKVLATVISLMEKTYIRIGNNEYEKIYGSYGLTTLKDKHVQIEGEHIEFSFNGKKGIHHDIALRNKKLAKTVKECRDIPGAVLFQYYDQDGNRKHIDSGMVNHYLQSVTGMDITAKDFRTWAGSVHALHALRSIDEPASETECKKNIVNVLDQVSVKLGNTRTVCKKYYVHPLILQLFEEKKLGTYLKELDEREKQPFRSGPNLSCEEEILLKILKSSH